MRFLITLALVLPALAMASATDDLLARLQQLHSMSGQFEQVVKSQDGTRMQQTQGEMTVARGNRFYWHTLKPYEQLAVSDGQQVWIYDKALRQVVVKPLNDNLGRTPALLFGGNPEAVAKSFAVSEADQDGDKATFRLRPRGSDPLFDVLEVTFKGNTPVSMRLVDALGQQTLIRFHDLSVNDTPPDSRFHFEPPEGVDVIRQK